MRRVATALAAVVALAAVACGSGQDPAVDTGTATTKLPPPSSGTSSTTAAAPAGTPFTGGGQPPFRSPASTTRAFLSAVRVAAHDGYERVVFEFEDAVPGYTVEYTERPVTEDGSGDPVEVQGNALLELRFENAATARVEGEKVELVYEGPERVPGPGIVREAVDAGDFEGVVTWVIGLRARPASLRVSALTNPPRVVVDVPTAT